MMLQCLKENSKTKSINDPREIQTESLKRKIKTSNQNPCVESLKPPNTIEQSQYLEPCPKRKQDKKEKGCEAKQILLPSASKNT